MSNNSSIDNVNISTTYSAHNVSPPVYNWMPKSIPYTQHYGGKDSSSSTGEASPNYGSNSEICNNKLLSSNICQTNISATYSAHNILKPMYKDIIISAPYTQHAVSHPRPKPSGSAGEASPPSNFNCAICTYGKNSCVCPPNISASYSEHNINKNIIINPTLAGAFGQHHIGPVNTRNPSKGEAPPPSQFAYSFNFFPGESDCLCKDPTAAPYTSHIKHITKIIKSDDGNRAPYISSSKVVQGESYAAPYVGHAKLYPPKSSTCLGGSAPPSYPFSSDLPKQKSSCECILPESAPYSQHVNYGNVVERLPTLDATFGSHMKQSTKYTPTTMAGRSNPRNHMSDFAVCDIDYVWKVSSTPYTQHTKYVKKSEVIKDNQSIGTTFGAHGKYPVDRKFIEENRAKEKCYDKPYDQHRTYEDIDADVGNLIQNKSYGCDCTNGIEQKLKPKKRISAEQRQLCIEQPKASFGTISNHGLNPGNKLPPKCKPGTNDTPYIPPEVYCKPFGMIENGYGTSIAQTNLLKQKLAKEPFNNNTYDPALWYRIYNKYRPKNAPYSQHSRYKDAPFGQISNNPHLLKYSPI